MSRSPGRPRSRTSPTGSGTRNDILAAAAELFCTNGYGSSSTHSIAKKAAVSQASMYHYFAAKSDILLDLLRTTVRNGIDAGASLDACEAPATAKLWALARIDADTLCNHPQNIGGLYLLPVTTDEAFAEFWSDWDHLRQYYTTFLDAAIQAGEITPPTPDAHTLTDLVIGAVESAILMRRRRHSATLPAMPDLLADSALRVAGASEAELSQAKQRGSELVATASQ